MSARMITRGRGEAPLLSCDGCGRRVYPWERGADTISLLRARLQEVEGWTGHAHYRPTYCEDWCPECTARRASAPPQRKTE